MDGLAVWKCSVEVTIELRHATRSVQRSERYGDDSIHSSLLIRSLLHDHAPASPQTHVQDSSFRSQHRSTSTFKGWHMMLPPGIKSAGRWTCAQDARSANSRNLIPSPSPCQNRSLVALG